MSFQPSLKFWNGVAIAAILALIATLAADYAFPKPTFRSRTEAKNKADNQAREQAYALAQDFEKQRTEIEARVWKESSDSVGAQTLDKATNMARAHALNLTAFRPQKPDEQGELTRLAYVMTLEGPYPGLQAMVRELETPSNRLSVHLVQVASADEGSDLVTATVGVSAFIEKPKTEPAAKGRTK